MREETAWQQYGAALNALAAARARYWEWLDHQFAGNELELWAAISKAEAEAKRRSLAWHAAKEKGKV